jgi:2-amino-4-hydroxy-6-hydroxymethyldihydropteridine diphosphokinase
MTFLGFGSNIGNRKQNIIQAINNLSDQLDLLDVADFYETAPFGFVHQPDFLNTCASFKTDLTPGELLEFVLSVENILGRQRSIPFGPRTIDIDILFYDQRIINTTNLVVPHAQLHDRDFVLKPLSDIAPNLIHPVYNKTITELLHNAEIITCKRKVPVTLQPKENFASFQYPILAR